VLALAIHKDAGCNACNFLNIEGVASSIARAGVACAMEGTDGVYANPAAISSQIAKEVMFTHVVFVEGISFGHLNFVLPTKIGAIGTSFTYLSYGTIEGRDSSGKAIQDYTSGDLSCMISYAKKFGKLSVGTNFKFINQKIERKSAFGLALDVGTRYVLFDNQTTKICFGAALQNLGTKVKFEKEEFPLPVNLKVGVIAGLLGNKLMIGCDVDVPLKSELAFGAGCEYRFANTLFLRAGYKKAPEGEASGLRAGVGVKVKCFRLDYSFDPFGKLGNAHRFSLSLRFP
jgi:hypothetical protein